MLDFIYCVLKKKENHFTKNISALMCPNVVDEWKGCENFRARWNDRAMQCK